MLASTSLSAYVLNGIPILSFHLEKKNRLFPYEVTKAFNSYYGHAHTYINTGAFLHIVCKNIITRPNRLGSGMYIQWRDFIRKENSVIRLHFVNATDQFHACYMQTPRIECIA